MAMVQHILKVMVFVRGDSSIRAQQVEKIAQALELWPTINIGLERLTKILAFVAVGMDENKAMVKTMWGEFRAWFDKHGTKFGDERFYGHCTINDGTDDSPRSVTLTPPTCKDVIFSWHKDTQSVTVTFEFPKRGDNVSQTRLLHALGCTFRKIDPETWNTRTQAWHDDGTVYYVGTGPEDEWFNAPEGWGPYMKVLWSEPTHKQGPQTRETNPASITQTKH